MSSQSEGKAAPTYRCPNCDAVSANPNDVAGKYCGKCHLFRREAIVRVEDAQKAAARGARLAFDESARLVECLLGEAMPEHGHLVRDVARLLRARGAQVEADIELFRGLACALRGDRQINGER